MTHALSASSSRFERMPLVAVAVALIFHALIGVALWAIHVFAPPIVPIEEAIEVTMVEPAPPPPPPPPAPPPPEEAAPPPPIVPGLLPPAPLTADKPTQVPPPADPGKEAMAPQPPSDELIVPPIVQPPPAERAPPEPAQEATASPKASDPAPAAPNEARPQPPAAQPDPPKEVALAPPPPPPMPEPAPPKHEPSPSPPQSHALAIPPPPRPAPPMPHQDLAPSPLRPGPQRQAPRVTPSDKPSPSPFVNPADTYNRARVSDNYLDQVVNKLRGYSYLAHATARYGVTVVRVVIARDGRLLDASIAQSSGQPEFDRGVLAGVRAGSPYAPLPPEIQGASATFTLPLISAVQR